MLTPLLLNLDDEEPQPPATTAGGATLRPRRIQPRPAWLEPQVQPVQVFVEDDEALLLCGAL